MSSFPDVTALEREKALRLFAEALVLVGRKVDFTKQVDYQDFKSFMHALPSCYAKACRDFAEAASSNDIDNRCRVYMKGNYRTRNGRAVQILSTTVEDTTFPVVGTVDQQIVHDDMPSPVDPCQEVMQWTATGRHIGADFEESELDLMEVISEIPVPPEAYDDDENCREAGYGTLY